LVTPRRYLFLNQLNSIELLIGQATSTIIDKKLSEYIMNLLISTKFNKG